MRRKGGGREGRNIVNANSISGLFAKIAKRVNKLPHEPHWSSSHIRRHPMHNAPELEKDGNRTRAHIWTRRMGRAIKSCVYNAFTMWSLNPHPSVAHTTRSHSPQSESILFHILYALKCKIRWNNELISRESRARRNLTFTSQPIVARKGIENLPTKNSLIENVHQIV